MIIIDTLGEEWFAHVMARLHRDVLDAVLARIVAGEYPVGSMLPKEQTLAAEFDISRGTAREALRALEERRVVVVKHGKGARVLPGEEWNVLDPAVAGALLASGRRREFVRELRAYREMLESEAAALAAEHATARQRDALRSEADELAEAGQAASIRRLIAVASGNRLLAATLRALEETMPPAGKATDVDACKRLAEAVVAGDADAAREAAQRLNGA